MRIENKGLKNFTHKNGKVKLWINDDAEVWRAEKTMVVNSALADGVTFTIASKGDCTASTTGTTMTFKTYSGAYYGWNVSRFSEDVRGFDTLTYRFTRSGDVTGPSGVNSGNSGYYAIVLLLGTEEQLKGVTVNGYNKRNLNGCTELFLDYNTNKTYGDSVAISATGTEPVYVGLMITGYHTGSATVEVAAMKVE